MASLRLVSFLTASEASGRGIYLSTFSTWGEVIDIKKIRSTSSTSTMGATWNSGSPLPPPPPPAISQISFSCLDSYFLSVRWLGTVGLGGMSHPVRNCRVELLIPDVDADGVLVRHLAE